MNQVLQVCLSPSEGGLELSTLHFSKMLPGPQGPSAVFCLENSFLAGRAKKAGITTVTAGKSVLSQVLSLFAALKKQPYEALFIHRLKDIRLIPFIKLFFPKIKIIGLAHIYVDRSKNDFLHRFQYSFFDSLISFTEVQSQALQKTLPVPAEKHFVLSHGVDLQRFQNLGRNHPQVQKKRAELGVSENEKLIGVVGRFDPQKGQFELVQAALEILKTRTDLRFIFVGEDTFNEPGTKKKCQDLVQVAGAERFFQFLPFTSDIQYFYPALDLFVMPSYKETFGLVLIEAMACSCPVMSTSAGGPVEILDHGKYGLLVSPRNFASLQAGLLQFLNDPQMPEHLSKQSRLRVEMAYSQDIMQSKLSQFLKNCIQG